MSEMGAAEIMAMSNNGLGGSNNIWWIILFLIFAGGGNWFGGNQNNSNVLDTDFASIDNKIDRLGNGLADGFYTNAQLVNGTNMSIANGFSQAEMARSSGTMDVLNAISGLGTQVQNSFCTNRYDGLQQMNALQNSIQNGFCQLNFNNQNNTRDIIENAKSNTRSVLESLNTQLIAQKDEKIAELNQMINSLNLTASQQAQNAYLISQLKTATTTSAT